LSLTRKGKRKSSILCLDFSISRSYNFVPCRFIWIFWEEHSCSKCERRGPTVDKICAEYFTESLEKKKRKGTINRESRRIGSLLLKTLYLNVNKNTVQSDNDAPMFVVRLLEAGDPRTEQPDGPCFRYENC